MVLGPPSTGDSDRVSDTVVTTKTRPPEEPIMNRITSLAAAGALVVSSGLGAWAANAATTDSAASHVRTTAPHGADDTVHHHRHHHGRGADDTLRHERQAEPRDDHGGARGVEPGDDHGGPSGHDD
jgi:hypothetical protein